MNEAARRGSARLFKVGDDVIERAKPFKLYAIKDLLPADSGEHTYQITDQGLGQERLRIVREGQIVALQEVLCTLLKTARIPQSDITKANLIIAICTARNAAQAQSIPADTLDNFLEQIGAVTEHLEKLKRTYGSSMGIRRHRHGDGVVTVLTSHSPLNPEASLIAAKLPTLLTPSPLTPLQLDGLDQKQKQLLQAWYRDLEQRGLIEHYCLIDMQKLLSLWSADLNRRRLGRGKKDKDKKADILPVAEHYFKKHAASARGSQKPFYEFAELFYKYVTGDEFFEPHEIEGLSDGKLRDKVKDTVKYFLNPKTGK